MVTHQAEERWKSERTDSQRNARTDLATTADRDEVYALAGAGNR
jgi:hypothetical protein